MRATSCNVFPATWSRSIRNGFPTISPTCWSSAEDWPGCGARWKWIPELSVLVVTKDEWRESNSNYAQGGIAGVMSPEDSFDSHMEDTLVAGGDLCAIRQSCETCPGGSGTD